MAAPKFKPVPVNVFESMVAYDPTSRDRNSYKVMRDEREKRTLVLETYKKYEGQQIKLAHLDGGEVMTVQVDGIFGRNMIQHMLFGSWRMATPADIERSEQIEHVRAEAEAHREAVAQAAVAGRFFSETLDAAEKIARFNDTREVAKPAKAKAIKEA
jgi:hypothetical protein